MTTETEVLAQWREKLRAHRDSPHDLADELTYAAVTAQGALSALKNAIERRRIIHGPYSGLHKTTEILEGEVADLESKLIEAGLMQEDKRTTFASSVIAV